MFGSIQPHDEQTTLIILLSYPKIFIIKPLPFIAVKRCYKIKSRLYNIARPVSAMLVLELSSLLPAFQVDRTVGKLYRFFLGKQ